MKLNSFFDNLSVYFEDEEDTDTPIKSSVYKDDDGNIIEIRIFNPDYNEMLAITRNGEVSAISIDDFLIEKENK